LATFSLDENVSSRLTAGTGEDPGGHAGFDFGDVPVDGPGVDFPEDLPGARVFHVHAVAVMRTRVVGEQSEYFEAKRGMGNGGDAMGG
jgi:hypothetical protein